MMHNILSRRYSTLIATFMLLAGCRRASAPAQPVTVAIKVDAGGGAPIACPPEMAPIPGFGCIDRYEASADIVSSDGGSATGLGSPDGTGTTIIARSRPGVIPLNNVSVGQARRACENAGKRLCGEHEWVAACRGPNHWEYPYGNTFEPKRCNDWNVVPYGPHPLAKTGEYARCVTPAGVYDLANNLGEWMNERSRTGPFHEIRGGTYHMTVHDSACDEDDYTAPPESQRPDIGFRCCR